MQQVASLRQSAGSWKARRVRDRRLGLACGRCYAAALGCIPPTDTAAAQQRSAMSLNATVQRLRNEEKDRKAVRDDRASLVSAWQSDVLLVYEAFEKALESFVDDGTARIHRGHATISEEMLGGYDIATLAIDIVGRHILLVPIARLTVRGTGRLDLYREDRPAESNRILVLRGSADVGQSPGPWVIQDRPDEPASVLQSTFMSLDAHRRSSRRTYRLLDGEAIQDSVDHLLNMS